MDYLVQILTRYRQEAAPARDPRRSGSRLPARRPADQHRVPRRRRGVPRRGLHATSAAPPSSASSPAAGCCCASSSGYTVLPALLSSSRRQFGRKRRRSTLGRKLRESKITAGNLTLPVTWIVLLLAGRALRASAGFDPGLLNMQAPTWSR